VIYHITTQSEWQQYKLAGRIEPESLRNQGFIHCASKEHVVQIASFYFTGRKDLILLEINESRIEADLKWEAADGEGPKVFPHVYVAIPLDCVEREVKWQANDSGEFEFPFKVVLH
jgi:uncharacterized protein (DUF952 family)